MTARAAAACALALALGGCASGSSKSGSLTTAAGSQFDGAALPAGVAAPPFTLESLSGTSLSLADLRGQVVVLAFLFSGCRACTLIAEQLRGALDQLRRPPAVVLVTVDPSFDTPARVRAFLAANALRGRADYMVGPRRALPAVWRAYRVRTPASGLDAYEQSAPVLLLDPLGHERVVYEQEQLTPEAIAHDVRLLEAPAGP